MFVFLLLDDPRGYRRLFVFGAAASLFYGLTLAMCYCLWGDNFLFWAFRVMGGQRKNLALSTGAFAVSLLRSADHTLRLLPELSIGVLAGVLIHRDRHRLRLTGPLWIAWLTLLIFEVYSSGVGWSVFWHFGPGVFIGLIWFCAALPHFWPTSAESRGRLDIHILNWSRSFAAVLCVVSLFTVMGVVPSADPFVPRYYKRRPPPDVYRYIADIENEFNGYQPETVLLDLGNWIYLRHAVLQRDRAVSLGDQAPNNIYENFDVMVRRICDKTYQKILVHDFHSPYFLYDWDAWQRPSGVREALSEHYSEIRTIPGVRTTLPGEMLIEYVGPVSVLVPKERPGLDSVDRDI